MVVFFAMAGESNERLGREEEGKKNYGKPKEREMKAKRWAVVMAGGVRDRNGASEHTECSGRII